MDADQYIKARLEPQITERGLRRDPDLAAIVRIGDPCGAIPCPLPEQQS